MTINRSNSLNNLLEDYNAFNKAMLELCESRLGRGGDRKVAERFSVNPLKENLDKATAVFESNLDEYTKRHPHLPFSKEPLPDELSQRYREYERRVNLIDLQHQAREVRQISEIQKNFELYLNL